MPVLKVSMLDKVECRLLNENEVNYPGGCRGCETEAQ